MGSLAIRAEHLGKMYQLGQRSDANYDTLRDRLAHMMAAPWRGLTGLVARSRSAGRSAAAARREEATLWALRDVSFEIQSGEVVGIIGRNGAGKSTLLKILSRITEPTRGRAEIYGRVASLLEVGTGFHPELTGRENIFLNGAILGMRRHEIIRKFDEIVAFAEIDRFIDTPVKFYSSGMYVRLAFAVAAHLEPEILVVDEVLAVGDSRFQKKCLNKMQDVGKEGRTVLFVSHSMPAITRMCERTILLNEGEVLQDGPSHKVVAAYLNAGHGTTALREWPDPARAPGGDVARLRAVRLRAADGQISEAIDIRQPCTLEMEYEVLQPGSVLMPHFVLYNEEGLQVFQTFDQDRDWRGRPRPVGRYLSTVTIPGNLLAEGALFVETAMLTLNPTTVQFGEYDTVAFQVIDSMDGDSARADWSGPMGGVVRPLLPWTTNFTPHSL